MYKPRDRYYLYHAYALAAGGYVTSDGNRQNIESAASVVLSMSGGSGHVTQTGYRFFWCGRESNFFIRIAESECEVTGYEDSAGYHTRSRSTLRGVDVNNVIVADKIESVVESLHTVAACASNPRQEPAIRLLSSGFEGLKVAGVAIEPKRSRAFDEFPTYDGLRAFVDGAGQAEFAELRPSLRAASLMDVPDAEPPAPDYVQDMCRRFVRNDVLRVSIFDPLNAEGLETYGSSIAVPDFGRIFLGDLVVTKSMKRLNMIKFDLGCDTEGGGTLGGSAVNGEPMP
jgi:hypothetical protein